MRVLNQMAQFILEDPYITAKQLAKKLGYAEEKTVYYWVDKASFRGLQSFKRAVLGGQFRVHGHVAKETRGRYGRVPVIAGFRPGGEPILFGETVTAAESPSAQWAWRYLGPPVGPFLTKDTLLISPWTVEKSTGWCLAQASTGDPSMAVRMVCQVDTVNCLLEPVSLAMDTASQPRYTIHQLIRTF
ncbi:MAG: hypothetical protein ACYCT0_00710 [Sulfobacillus sp.]